MYTSIIFPKFQKCHAIVFQNSGSHFLEVYILALEIQDKIELIFGVKNVFELEGEINSKICSVNFLNRLLPIFPVAFHKIKPGKMACVKVRILFVEKLSGITNVKLMYKYHIDTMRARIYHSQSILQIINNIDETIHYTPQLSTGIVDIHSLSYYNVTKSVLFFDRRGNNQLPPPSSKSAKITPTKLLQN